MKFEDFKHKIIDNKLDDNVIIIKYTNNCFIADQYISKIASNKKLDIRYIDRLDINNPIIDIKDKYLSVLNIEKFELENINCLKNISNTIVLCKDTSNTIPNNYIVILPEPTKDHIIQYMNQKCPGLSKVELEWIYSITKGNIFNIDNELKKIDSVPIAKQHDFFTDLINTGNYSYLYEINIYDLLKAINTHNLKLVGDILNNNNYSISATYLYSILYSNIKNIIDVSTNTSATASSLNMNPKQFNAIKYYSKNYDLNKLTHVLDFLLTIDKDLKNGRLDMENDRLIDYILCNIL